MMSDMKSGLLPITTLVRSDLAMETGQLTAKQQRKRTSQILKSAIILKLNDTVFANVMIQHLRVVVDEIVDFLGTHHEGGDDFASVQPFVGPVDDPFLDQRKDAVGEHFGVNADVFVVLQARKDGVGDGADAHLQTGTVFDQFSAVTANGFLRFCGIGELRQNQRSIILYQIIDFTDMNL